jgi:ataxin-3
LRSFGEYTATPVENSEMRKSIKDYGDEEAFICHSVDHWIAIRKLYNVWYNLNSTNMYEPGPQIISDFYLSAFLDSIKNSGYTIFVIRGQKLLPLPNKY